MIKGEYDKLSTVIACSSFNREVYAIKVVKCRNVDITVHSRSNVKLARALLFLVCSLYIKFDCVISIFSFDSQIIFLFLTSQLN